MNEREREQVRIRQQRICKKREDAGLKELRYVFVPKEHYAEIKEEAKALVKRVIRKYEKGV